MYTAHTTVDPNSIPVWDLNISNTVWTKSPSLCCAVWRRWQKIKLFVEMANLKEIIPVSVAVSEYVVAVQSTITPAWMGYSALRKKNHLFQEHNKITLLRVRTRTSYFTTTSSTFVELPSATAVCNCSLRHKKCHNVHVSDSWLLYNFESLIINHSKYSTYHLKNFLWQRLLAIPHHAVYKFTRFWSKTDTDSNYIVY